MFQHQFSRGVTLIESLVAMMLIALAVLGIISIQMVSLSDTQAGIRRNQAIRLINDLSERIQTHPDAFKNIRIYTQEPTPSLTKSCLDAIECTSSELANRDIFEWHNHLKQTFGDAQAQIFLSAEEAAGQSHNIRQIGVLIAWREKPIEANDSAATEDINFFLKIPEKQASGKTCPQGYVCHLQYIPLHQRCTRLIGSSEGALFCPT